MWALSCALVQRAGFHSCTHATTQGEENKLQAMLSPWNICDALAFLPPLLETMLVLCGSAAAPGSLLRGYDMRFFKLLRCETTPIPHVLCRAHH